MQAVATKTLQSVLQSSARSVTKKTSFRPHLAAVAAAPVAGYSRCLHQTFPRVQLQSPPPPTEFQQGETAPPESSANSSPENASLQENKDQTPANSASDGTSNGPPFEKKFVTTGGGDPDAIGPRSPTMLPLGNRTISRRDHSMDSDGGEVVLEEPTLPEWFYEESVFLSEELADREENIELYTDETEVDSRDGVQEGDEVTVYPAPTSTEASEAAPPVNAQSEDTDNATVKNSTPTSTSEENMKEYEVALQEFDSFSPNLTTSTSSLSSKYLLHRTVWEEILAQVRGSLMLPKATFIDGLTASKSHCVLLFPQPGGTYFLDSIVEKVAGEVSANLIRIDPQDLEEFTSEYCGDTLRIDAQVPQISLSAVSSLGYEAQLQNEYAREPEDLEEETAEEEAEVEEAEEPESPSNRTSGTRGISVKPVNTPSGNFPEILRKLFSMKGVTGKMYALSPSSNGRVIPIEGGNIGKLFSSSGPSLFSDGGNELLQERKMSLVLSALLGAGEKKRLQYENAEKKPASATMNAIEQRLRANSKTIIHIRDYVELESTGQNAGEGILKAIHSIVDSERRQGKQIVIIGTTSSEQELEHLTRSGIRALQAGGEYDQERAILVPPHLEVNRVKFNEDQMRRVREVNVRHLRDVIRQRSGDSGQQMDLYIPKDWHLHLDEGPSIADISNWVWSYNTVHRTALAAIGLHSSDQNTGEAKRIISLADIDAAVSLLSNSDQIKASWASDESSYQQSQTDRDEEIAEKSRLDKISQTCTVHEKKLLTGVINPADITTGFSSVQAANETVDALKTLTSLSLTRPEAFSYGVLARNRIPGVLLYGPPGTGKTLLAKAVAKESGATVLEVSGSEVFDMYVGEGEKNVKAIFSLAKKLSPCVVFIDEADAIFGSRHSHSTRATHRELINQFLKEWDGMLTTSAFIMVATNRPFDLDDAVIRRLPRRLLVDLPDAKDRLEIMKIHLLNEDLASDVDLADIASDARTNLYSGSDLKNVCVAAALSCVKEENESYKSTGTYPKHRTLRKHHFDKALEDISASISDDMGSLQLIRKFDEKYGDKHGRQKRKPKWGFANAVEDPKDRGTGRVRN